jgi:hypothetical protein
MKRIDSPNRALALFGAGKDGFKATVPGVSSATELTAKWFNAVQEAIVRLIEGTGTALSEADYDQFTAAVQWYAAQAAVGKVTQGGGAGQIAGILKIGAAAGGKVKVDVGGVDQGNVAFEAWVAQQLANLVNSSPAALDTLSELASAMGNDANFAVTMTNALAGKERRFDSGTMMLFQQTTAPIGWTKVTTHNNKALRVVSGAAGSGGTIDFTTAFVNGNVGATGLSVAQMPSHSHTLTNVDGSDAAAGSGLFVSASAASGVGTITPSSTISTTGGDQTHTHTLNLDVKYVDIIIASKD